ncbi:MAG: hypothetical protein D6706_04290 [Chloroflexi bacterium]|nr:MAG: hypothetical protein D6706_04290 [Chloroflexota bacterium]
MSRLDPLKDWLLDIAIMNEMPAQRQNQLRTEISQGIGRLVQYLQNNPSTTSHKWREVCPELFFLGTRSSIIPDPTDIPNLKLAYRTLIHHPQTQENTLVQEIILHLLAAAEEASLIPFWLELLDINRPRDILRHQRYTLALAALSRMAIHKGEDEAFEALRLATYHPNPEVRGLAVYYWGQAYVMGKRPFPPTTITELQHLATNDPAFEPRYQARRILLAAKESIPRDNKEGTYHFRVRPKGITGIFRVIALKANQTMHDLHLGILGAYGWVEDHLFAFYMNGRKYDDRFAIVSPYETERTPHTNEVHLDELGLIKGHAFLYHFDYTRDHLFEVTVTAISPHTDSGPYPRVIERCGKAPQQ